MCVNVNENFQAEKHVMRDWWQNLGIFPTKPKLAMPFKNKIRFNL